MIGMFFFIIMLMAGAAMGVRCYSVEQQLHQSQLETKFWRKRCDEITVHYCQNQAKRLARLDAIANQIGGGK